MRATNRLSLVVLLVAAPVCLRAGSAAGSVIHTLAPALDVSVTVDDQVQDNSNLEIGRKGSFALPKRGFLRFDLPAGGHEVTRATLRVYLEDTEQYGWAEVHPVAAPWDCETVLYNQAVSAPLGRFAETGGAPAYTAPGLGWYEIDVAPAVQGWIDDPASNYGFRLIGDEGSTYTSRVFSALGSANPPQLVIELTPEPSALLLMVAGAAVPARRRGRPMGRGRIS